MAKKAPALENLEKARKFPNKRNTGEPKFQVTKTMRDTIQEVWSRLQVGTNEKNEETSLYALASSDPKWFYELIRGMFPKNLFVEAEIDINRLSPEDLRLELVKLVGTLPGIAEIFKDCKKITRD